MLKLKTVQNTDVLYVCTHCGRIMSKKVAHNCNTGFRKRHPSWAAYEKAPDGQSFNRASNKD